MLKLPFWRAEKNKQGNLEASVYKDKNKTKKPTWEAQQKLWINSKITPKAWPSQTQCWDCGWGLRLSSLHFLDLMTSVEIYTEYSVESGEFSIEYILKV